MVSGEYADRQGQTRKFAAHRQVNRRQFDFVDLPRVTIQYPKNIVALIGAVESAIRAVVGVMNEGLSIARDPFFNDCFWQIGRDVPGRDSFDGFTGKRLVKPVDDVHFLSIGYQGQVTFHAVDNLDPQLPAAGNSRQ